MKKIVLFLTFSLVGALASAAMRGEGKQVTYSGDDARELSQALASSTKLAKRGNGTFNILLSCEGLTRVCYAIQARIGEDINPGLLRKMVQQDSTELSRLWRTDELQAQFDKLSDLVGAEVREFQAQCVESTCTVTHIR